MIEPFDMPYARLASEACAPHAEMLVAIEREFHAVQRAELDERLDDLARAVFAAPDPLRAVARAAWDALPAEDDAAPCWLAGCAMAEGAATGCVRAGLAAEIARRAGVGAVPGCLDERAVLIADGAAADLGEALPGRRGPLCAHQLGFDVLTGLAAAWARDGDRTRARQAAGLRLLLPLDEDLRARLRGELEERP